MSLSVRFAVAESLLLGGLLLLAAFVLLESVAAGGLSAFLRPDVISGFIPERFSRELLLWVALGIALYWALHALGLGHAAFWLMALLVILPQSMAIWSHNQIEWHQLFSFKPGVADGRSLLTDIWLFLTSLVGLAALYRSIGLRQLDRRMSLQGIESADRARVAVYEGLMLAGLVFAALLLTFLIMTLSTTLGGLDVLLERSSWTVVAVGGGATVLLALTLALWFRVRQA